MAKIHKILHSLSYADIDILTQNIQNSDASIIFEPLLRVKQYPMPEDYCVKYGKPYAWIAAELIFPNKIHGTLEYILQFFKSNSISILNIIGYAPSEIFKLIDHWNASYNDSKLSEESIRLRLSFIYNLMYQHTKTECATGCKIPHSCCGKVYCELAKTWAKDIWNVDIPYAQPTAEIPYLSTDETIGCILSPHLRPM